MLSLFNYIIVRNLTLLRIDFYFQHGFIDLILRVKKEEN